jgi:hypothetical protein
MLVCFHKIDIYPQASENHCYPGKMWTPSIISEFGFWEKPLIPSMSFNDIQVPLRIEI